MGARSTLLGSARVPTIWSFRGFDDCPLPDVALHQERVLVADRILRTLNTMPIDENYRDTYRVLIVYMDYMDGVLGYGFIADREKVLGIIRR